MIRSVGTRISGAFSAGGKQFKTYWINLFNDYKNVFTETVTELRSKPWKGVAVGSTLAAVVYTVKTNPDEQHFVAATVLNQSTLCLIGDPIRNPISNDRVQSIVRLLNENRLGRLNLIFFSVMWRRDYGKDIDLYAAQCKVLKPSWRDFNSRFIDIGFCGRWMFSELSMRDYDVNETDISLRGR